MPAEIEKSVRKWLDQLDSKLMATPPDIAACQKAFTTLRVHTEKLLNENFPPIQLSGRDWSHALLAQAREDLRAAELIAGAQTDPPASVVAMLMQMVFEKLAKAALARTDKQCFEAYRTSHAAASKFILQIKNHQPYLGLRHKFQDVFPMVQALERAHPALARGGPHLEYPWEGAQKMCIPAMHLPIVKQFSDPRDPMGPKLFRFARELSDRFDEFFR